MYTIYDITEIRFLSMSIFTFFPFSYIGAETGQGRYVFCPFGNETYESIDFWKTSGESFHGFKTPIRAETAITLNISPQNMDEISDPFFFESCATSNSTKTKFIKNKWKYT